MSCLGSDFDPIVASLSTRIPPPYSMELLSHLLTFEARLNHQISSSLPTPEITTYTVAITPNPSNKGRGNGNRGRGSGRGGRFGGRGSSGGRGNGGRFFNGAARGSLFNGGCGGFTGGGRASSNPIICQVCGKSRHGALVCYHRFNQSYQESPPSSIAANYSSISAFDSHMWYPDTGATHII